MDSRKNYGCHEWLPWCVRDLCGGGVGYFFHPRRGTGDPVANALVDGTFSGDFNETFYDVQTDGNGDAVFTTAGCIKKPSFSFTVDDVTDTLPYDPGDDLATGCSG
jgi:hypothetical protein